MKVWEEAGRPSQYDGHEVEQHAHKMHSYSPSSLARSSLDWYSSLSPAAASSLGSARKNGSTDACC